MTPPDLVWMAWRTLAAQRRRSGLTVLGIVVGIASVTLLTSIGEGVRAYITQQFTQFGTDLLAVQPGNVQTWGVPGFLGGTQRKLTLADARALERVRGVRAVEPLVYGMARVEHGGVGRHVYVYGATHRLPEVYALGVRAGRFLPPIDPEQAGPVCVLGATLKRELFGEGNALGQRVRIGGSSLRVIGVMEAKGTLLGIDIDDVAYVPLGLAMRIFDRDALSGIDIKVEQAGEAEVVAQEVRRLLKQRHDGREDFTVVEQAAMLETFDKVLRVITSAVVGIAAISLLVGALGILTVQWIAVSERTAEIGVAMAVGARRRQVLTLFLAEAAMLGVLGGALGLAAGFGGAGLLALLVPGLPLRMSLGVVVVALGVSLAVGLVAGAAPAVRASRLDPVEALRAE